MFQLMVTTVLQVTQLSDAATELPEVTLISIWTVVTVMLIANSGDFRTFTAFVDTAIGT